MWNGIVQFDEKTTRGQKRVAWGLNLDCFIAFRGCTDISQLLPAVWKLTDPAAVSSRVHSSADSNAEASQPLAE
jgi:hypothetical protein